MAIAMEVASWRGSEQVTSPRKKRAWGADAHQLMQLMMGQLQTQQQPAIASSDVKPEAAGAAELTLDLFRRRADPSHSPVEKVPQLSYSPEFLHLDPEDSELPSCGGEKCLDLQSGKLYFVNRSSGVSTFDDPRKQLRNHHRGEIELQTQAQAQEYPLAHEFLGSKKSETLRQESLRASSSSSSGSPRPVPHLPPSFSNAKQLWNVQLNDRRTVSSSSSPRVVEDSGNLELDLNLAAGGSSPPCRPVQQQAEQLQSQSQQTVCTMEMIQKALRRSEQTLSTAMAKREQQQSVALPGLRLKRSVSSSFSSLTNSGTRSSEPSGAEPSTSSSSSASSRSGSRASLTGSGRAARSHPSSQGVCEAESMKTENSIDPGALVMGACTRCLMYVMLNRSDPRCPRCDSRVPVDFSSAPPRSKKQRGGVNLGYGCR